MLVVVGSLNVDLAVEVERFPRPGETLLASDYTLHLGGKGGNQAVAAARLGGKVRMIARVGEDHFGWQLRQGLLHEGIDVDEVRAVGPVSGVAWIQIAPGGENTVTVAPGANRSLRPEDLSPELFDGARAVLAQLEIPLGTVEQALRRAREVGALRILNAAPATSLDRILDEVDLLVVNEHEAGILAGREPQTSEEALAIASSLARKVPQAVVTLGAQGLVFAGREGEGMMAAFPVEAIDTTASGDAFVGALAEALVEGRPFREALRWGAAAGALAATRRGAQPSLPRREALLDLLGQL